MSKIIGIINLSGKKNNRQLDVLRQMSKPLEAFFKYKKNFYNDNYLVLGYLGFAKETNNLFESKDKKTLVLFSGYLLEERFKNPAKEIFRLSKGGIQNLAKELNGVFNILIYQKDKKKLYIINDRYGVKPLYYYQDKDRLIFSSEVKAIAVLNEIDKEIDWVAWSDYFSFRYLLGNKTFFKKIKSLSNASILEVKNNKINLNKYWDYSNIKIDNEHNEDYFLNKGKELVKDAIVKSCVGLKEGICFLSGGYDSRCLAAALKKYTKVKFETFTTQHPTGERDYVLAKKVAVRLKVKNSFIKHPKNIYQKYFLKKNYLLDGMAQEHLWALPLADHFKKTKVVFDGLAGDLLLKGLFLDNYNLSFLNNNKKLSLIIADQYGYSLFFIKKFFKKEVRKNLNFSKKSLFDQIKLSVNSDNKISVFFAKNRTRNALCLSSGNIFMMLEKRFPFLDNDLVNFALSIPPDIKINKHLYFEILKGSFPELRDISTTNDENFLKKLDRLIWRFLTILRLQKIVKSFLKNYLFSKQLANGDINYLFSLLKKIEMPEYINKERVDIYLARKKFDFSLFCLIEHLVWYNFSIKKLSSNPSIYYSKFSD